MRAVSYYSCDPGEAEVYHSYRQCPVGRSIPLLCRRHGTNGLKRCAYCVSLDQEDSALSMAGAVPAR
jgi:hypothetical protein